MKYEKNVSLENIRFNMIYKFCLTSFLIKRIIILLESYRNVYKKLSAKHECHDENLFPKADKALSKLNFLFHLKSKTNLVTLRKCYSHLQYYKIDLSFSIKLQEINL